MAYTTEGGVTGCDGEEEKRAGSMVAGLDTTGVNGRGVEGVATTITARRLTGQENEGIA